MTPEERKTLLEHKPSGGAMHCSLHDCDLVEGEARVLYGFGAVPEYFDRVDGDEYLEAWIKTFYYARTWMPGGCSVSGNRPAITKVDCCPDCRQAEQLFLEKSSGV